MGEPVAYTALDIITGALRNIGSYAPGETLDASDANDAMATLNDMLDTWSTEHLTVFSNDENTFTLVSGKSSYTVGTGGDIPITRALRITSGYTRISASGGGIDYGFDLVSSDTYSSIGLKSQPGPWPKIAYYDANYPLATLYLWPVPTQAGTVHLWSDSLFTTFANLTDLVNLPQGYARALKKNLALELAPEYKAKVSPLLLLQAKESKAALKALNATPVTPSTYDDAMTQRRGHDAGWIMHGGFQ